MKTMSETWAVAARQWSVEAARYVRKHIRETKLSGSPLWRVGGLLWDELLVVSALKRGDGTGFIARTSYYGYFWEKGFTLKRYGYSKTRKPGGKKIRKGRKRYGRGLYWDLRYSKPMAARPWLEPGVESALPTIRDSGGQFMEKASEQFFSAMSHDGKGRFKFGVGK